MENDINAKIVALKNESIPELQKKFEVLFDDQKGNDNKAYIIKKIANRLQELEYGGLPDEVKRKIIDLIEKYDPINNKALRPQVVSAGKNVVSIPFMRDKRLPIPGSVIHKKYKDQDIHVKVLDKGFEYKDRYYKSLTSIAFELTGAHWNGFAFFNL